VPDIYQGTELWDLSLVDPDNRRQVDFDRRRELLIALRNATVEQVMERMDDGLPKMWLIRQALRLRQEESGAVGPHGGYEPLHASGARADHVVGLIRGGRVIALVPRWTTVLGGDWAGTSAELPEGSWRNVLTSDSVSGGAHEVASLLSRFPVALLKREGA